MLENKKFIYSVLIVSLAFNFFIIGGAGYYTLKWKSIRADSNWIEERADRAQERVLRHLEGADRDLAERVFDSRRQELRTAIKDIRMARKDFRQSLRAETPDSGDITTALNQSQAAAQRVNEALHGALRDMAQGLSLEARQKISARMRKHEKRHERDER